MNIQLWIGGNTFIYLQHLNMLDLPFLCELTRVWFSSTILINWYWYSGSGTAWFASQSWCLKFQTVWNSDGFAWKLSQKGHYFPKLLSFCCSSCSFLWQVGNIAIDPISQNGIKNNPGLRGSFYKCINSTWFESCTKCLGFDLSAATLGKIRLDPFPLFRFEDLYRYGIRFLEWVIHMSTHVQDGQMTIAFIFSKELHWFAFRNLVVTLDNQPWTVLIRKGPHVWSLGTFWYHYFLLWS